MSVLTNKDITWRVIKGLKQLYEEGITVNTQSFRENPYVKNYLFKDKIISESYKYKNKIEVLLKEMYIELFENGFKDLYEKWSDFLIENDLLSFSTNCDYKEEDIICLMKLKEEKDNGLLDKDFIHDILALNSYKANIQYVSNAVFDNEKHLIKDSILEKATIKILNVSKFLYDSHEAIYGLPCTNTKPKLLIVCENHFYLKQASLADKFQIDFISTDGKNYKKINRFINRNRHLNVPVYYSCDWDKDGLQIFEGLKGFLKDNDNENFRNIKLLTPYFGKSKQVNDIKHNHKSEWKKEIPLSGLQKNLYSNEQIEIIQQLINKDEWIAEQGFDFEEMLKLNNCI